MAELLLALSAAPAIPAVAEIEKAALDARLAIRSMYVRLSFDNGTLPPQPGKEYAGVRTVWLDGKKIRSEVVYSKGPNTVGLREVNCLHCEKDGYGVSWLARPNTAASLHPIGAPGRPGFDQVIDPRLLGYYPAISAMLRPSQSRLDAIFSPDRNPPTVATEQLNGTECRVLQWTMKDGLGAAVWVAPSKGNNIVRIKLEDATSVDLLVSEDVTAVGQSGLWFPRVVRYETYKAGELTRREVVRIEEVRLNEPIDPSVFTLAGLALTEGTYVQTPDAKQSGFLRDGKIDTSRPKTRFEDTAPPTPLTAPPAGPNYWLVGACVALVLAAVAVIAVRRRA